MSESDPVFLDVDDVVWIHDVQLELFGGQAGIRDQGLLESAVAMARQWVTVRWACSRSCPQNKWARSESSR